PTWAGGKLYGGLAFNGTSAYVNVTPNAAFNVYPITVSAWFKTSSTADNTAIVNKFVSGSNNGYQLFMFNGAVCAWYFVSGTVNVYDATSCTLSASGFNDNNWHLATFVVDSTGGKLYVD